jgi:hypothetical protein
MERGGRCGEERERWAERGGELDAGFWRSANSQENERDARARGGDKARVM